MTQNIYVVHLQLEETNMSNEMHELMHISHIAGYKVVKILPEAAKLEPGITKQQVLEYFKDYFMSK